MLDRAARRFLDDSVLIYFGTLPLDACLQEHVERLAAYEVPGIVRFRHSLPKSAVGKYLCRELRNR